MVHTVHLLFYKSFIVKYYSSLFHYHESTMYKLCSKEKKESYQFHRLHLFTIYLFYQIIYDTFATESYKQLTNILL